jgi:hypothetical protein
MNVVTGNYIIQHSQTISLLGLKQPVLPTKAITIKFEQEIPIMASMRDVPDGTWHIKTVCSGHI